MILIMIIQIIMIMIMIMIRTGVAGLGSAGGRSRAGKTGFPLCRAAYLSAFSTLSFKTTISKTENKFPKPCPKL